MKPQRLYTGNTFTEEHFNSIIDVISRLENQELTIDQDKTIFEEGSTYAGSEIQFVRNSLGFIESVIVQVKEKADRTPFTSTDNITFENEFVTDCDVDSDYQVLSAESGLPLQYDSYTLRSNGQLVFAQALESNKVLVNGLDYVVTRIYYLGRDEDGRITKISMNPLEDTTIRERQRLVPDLIANSDVMKVYGPAISDYSYAMFEEGTENIPNSALKINSDRTSTFFLEFNEPLMVTDFEFTRPEIESSRGTYFSFDVFGSNDQGVWTRLLRVRNIDDSYKDIQDGKFRFNIAFPRSYKYLKFDILDWGSTYAAFVHNFLIYGYHPRNINLRYNENIMGRYLYNESFNGTIKVSGTVTDQNFQPYKVFNLDNYFTIKEGETFTIEFIEPSTVYSYRFVNALGTPPLSWRLLGSNDLVNWVTQDERTKGDWKLYEAAQFEVASPRKFKYYRYAFDDGSFGANYAVMKAFVLNGER